MRDASVDVREVMLTQVHRHAHGLSTVVGDPPASGARDLGDQAMGIQAPEAAADGRARRL